MSLAKFQIVLLGAGLYLLLAGIFLLAPALCYAAAIPFGLTTIISGAHLYRALHQSHPPQ